MATTGLVLFALVFAYVKADSCGSVLTDSCYCITTTSGTTECEGFTTSAQLKTAFSTKSPETVESITVTNSNELTSLPAEVFGQVRSRNLYFGKTGLTTVEDNAFQGLEDVLESLVLNDNQFSQFNYESLRNLKKLNGFRLSNDKLTEIPDDAFANFPHLHFIDFANNSITTVSKATFESIKEIRAIDLSGNKLTNIGAEVFSLAQSSDRVTINLNSNQISTIHRDAFKGLKLKQLDIENNQLQTITQEVFEPLLNYLSVSSGGSIHAKGNPFKCDSNIRWLVAKPRSYKRGVTNFRCKGKPLNQLTESDLTE